jgi:hypothetical protein
MVLATALVASRLMAFQAAPPDLAVEARNQLFAGRSDYAATLFQKLVDQEPTRGDAYYGLVRALLQDHKSQDAYAAAARVGLSGIIGMPVLMQLKVTIDYRNGTVRMEYKKP